MIIPMLAEHGPLDHVVDHPWVQVGPITVMSKHIFMQLLVAAVLILSLTVAFARPALVPRGLRNLFEAVCVYLRESVARPVLGPHTDRFIPYLWTVFFFILLGNLAGMIPFAASFTGNIWVTATMAVITMGMVVINGLRLSGWAYVAHFNPGPLWLAPLMVPLELLQVLTRGFALAVRLFANMIAGHILLAVLTSLIGVAIAAIGAAGFLVGGVVVLSNAAISLLEVLVAVLQAYIFTFLTTLFLGQAVNIQHHGHEEHGGAAHDRAGGH